MIKLSTLIKLPLILFTLSLLGCETQQTETHLTENVDPLAYVQNNEIYNPEAVIPPQCYTKTNGQNNPCYVCHQSYPVKEKRANMMQDGELQGQYQFSDVGTKNSWLNLFKDRSEFIEKISDKAIQQYVREDNYTPFIDNLKKDKTWAGVIPEIKNLELGSQAFNDNGFAKDNSHWVAFNYKPFPSTFWPTNGSTGDVMIRLPAAFREINGKYSQDVYIANLALLEMTIKQLNEVSMPDISEHRIGLDLNQDKQLSIVDTIKRQTHYLGDAKHIELADMLYPQDTEFLHTVRYLGIDQRNQIHIPQRMKEVRYMRKYLFKSPESLRSAYYLEQKEKHFEKLPQTAYSPTKGVSNGFGWAIQAFIENKQGQLRLQSHEEMSFCNGCHKTIGSTLDQTFSFPRKVEGKAGWGYINLNKITDVPNKGEQLGEYLTYMQRVKGGDEFRQNTEMLNRWFTTDGQLNTQKIRQLKNIGELILPSAERANKLNKAYLSIVKEQSYIYGRDATLNKAINVLTHVDDAIAPLEDEFQYKWDIRLDWQPK